MNPIEIRLVEAYSVLVMCSKYILNESDRVNDEQKLVPIKFKENVEIRVSEKTINILS